MNQNCINDAHFVVWSNDPDSAPEASFTSILQLSVLPHISAVTRHQGSHVVKKINPCLPGHDHREYQLVFKSDFAAVTAQFILLHTQSTFEIGTCKTQHRMALGFNPTDSSHQKLVIRNFQTNLNMNRCIHSRGTPPDQGYQLTSESYVAERFHCRKRTR